jgi:hypothetical protein
MPLLGYRFARYDEGFRKHGFECVVVDRLRQIFPSRAYSSCSALKLGATQMMKNLPKA